MKKRIALILFVFLSLCSCAENTEQSTIANGVNPSEPSMFEEPSNAQALEPYADVRGIDGPKTLAVGEYTPEDIRTYWFNENTIFEGSEELASNIMETGKAPGLYVSELHAQGITGENVTVAIIDQPLLLDHPEYAGKIEQYHTVGLAEKDRPSSMHGPAVTSLLAGNTIGTAPGVKLYYVAIKAWERSAPEMGAQALDWLIEQNEALPEAEKIRAVSVSADFTNTEYFDNHSAWDEAVNRAQDANILVLDCRREYATCLFWPSYFDPDNRDELALCKIGTPDGDFQDCPQQAMGTPVGYRTTAEIYYENEYSYSYDAIGGHSWAIPYGTGILALGWQLNPSLTGQELIELMRQTAYRDAQGNRFVNPSAFIESVLATNSDRTPSMKTDIDIAHSSLMKEDEDVSRLLKDRVSEKVLDTINSCDAGTWYVVVENEYQYIYYNGVPYNYAWEPEISQDSATIQIFDIGKSELTSTYVLLKVPASLKLDVYYNATKIKYEKVNI